MLDKLENEIKIGSKIVVAGAQGELQRMIVEDFKPCERDSYHDVVKCRPTDEDSCAKVKKLFRKRAIQCIVIDELVEGK